MNAEQNNPQTETTELNLDIIEDNASSDFVYILDDGTQINASQIQFDDDENSVDLTVESLPFVKYNDEEYDETEITDEMTEIIKYEIIGSPIIRRSKTVSPKRSFVSSLPFKLLSSKAKNLEAQIKKYLDHTPIIPYTVDARNKSPELIVETNEAPSSHANSVEETKKTQNISSFTREQVLNMFKNSPVVTNVGENSENFMDKPRHVRKTDPSRPVQKKSDHTLGYVHSDNSYQSGNNCFMCNKYVNNSREKLYLFDKEDQKLHRSSPQRKLSTQLKIICEKCLEANFKPSRLKSPEKSLNSDEYLVIRNNQQYIFQRIIPEVKNFINDAKAIIDKVESEILNQGNQDNDVEFVKIEIGTDGEIFNKNANEGNEDVIIIKEEIDDSSSDVKIVESPEELDDNVLHNLEEASEDVKEFLGSYQKGFGTDMKCRLVDLH